MHLPPRTILAASDLASGSDVVVRVAALLARRTGAALHLVTVVDLPWASMTGPNPTAPNGRADAAEARLREQGARALPGGAPPASAVVGVPPAHRAILARAQEVSADLLVVGPHRGGAAGAHLLGTTADRVLRAATVPCLVVGGTLPDRVRSIGVPIDPAAPSPGALETALGWALALSEPGAEGPVDVHVMSVGWPVEKHDDPGIEDRTLRPALHDQVRDAASRIPGADAVDVFVEVLWENDPAGAILGWADARGIDVLVMGTRAERGLRRMLLGSTASGVARQARRPVVLVPPSVRGGEASGTEPGHDPNAPEAPRRP